MRQGVLVLFLLIVTIINAQRQEFKMDYDWKFLLLSDNVLPNCPPNSFPINMNGIQCIGLSQVPANDADTCAKQCCSENTCETWQWCPTGATNCGPPGSCWVGLISSCQSGAGWQGGGRNNTPPINPTKCEEVYCQPGYDDRSWRTLNVPHDFVIEGTFNQSAEKDHGYLPKGVGWYRKHFTVPADILQNHDRIWIYFDGVYRDSDVYLNGYFLGNHASGYTSFWYYADQYLTSGENVLAVKANALQDEGWWYEGGGIYRHVWLYAAYRIHIPQWQVYSLPTVTGTIYNGSNGLMASSARFSVETTVQNDFIQSFPVQNQIRIIDANGNVVGSTTTNAQFAAPGANTTFQASLVVQNVNLWDVDNPYLYKLVSSAIVLGKEVDSVVYNVGVRQVMFLKDSGLYLNGRSVKVKGFCNHQDFAGVGTAVPDRINEFRVTKLQEMGANAWRMSHNPPNSELLDFTDKHGMLVWDENRNFGNISQYYSDVAILPLRDRNHPSIVIWSLCNEVGCMENANDPNSLAIAQKMKAIIQEFDKSRPVSAAWNANLQDLLNGWGPKVLDLQGVNYNYGEIDPYHSQYPDMPMISSETASCTGARGVYMTNATAAHMSIFNANGCTIEWWTADETRAFIAGGFAWTGFDYKGEPTPYSWPEVNSNFGTIDIAGFPKDTFWYYQSWWTKIPVLHVFPHWNAPEAQTGLMVTPCNSADKAQSFNFTGSETIPGNLIDSNGMCVDATCNSISDGCVPLQFVPCVKGNTNQLFTHAGDGSFRNQANGGCMDLWDSGQGPQVGVYQCDGGQNQHWQIQGSQVKSVTGGNRCMTDSPVKQVWVYTNAYSVELLINGKSQGRQQVPLLGNVVWDVVWVPGTIQINAYNQSGNTINTRTLETTGTPYAIKLSIEVGSEGINADQQDVAMLNASIVDSRGRIVPNAGNFITFTSTGPGEVVGVGNGDPSCHEPDRASSRSAFNGLARAIVQSTNTPGTITVTASSPGLMSASVQVQTKRPSVKVMSL